MIEWEVVVSYLLLGVLVFGFSASVEIASFKEKLKKGRGILIGLACQFILLPFIGFCVVKIFDLKEIYGITLLVVTSSPGGSYSNWWCSLFNADLALSVAMTTASTIISAGMLPLNLIIYISAAYNEGNAQKHLKWGSLFLSIGVVIFSVLFGLAVSSKLSTTAQARSNKLGNLAGVALITFSAFISSRDEPIWDKDGLFYIAIALPCLIAIIVSCSLTSIPRCELKKPERVAVAIETSYQNVGIATAVALSMFEGDDRANAVGVPLYYGVAEAVLLAIFCLIAWKAGWTLAPPTENLLKALAGDYQIRNGDEDDPEVPGISVAPGVEIQTTTAKTSTESPLPIADMDSH